ncbi:peripherin-2, partial [Biomphalaria glabrata]
MGLSTTVLNIVLVFLSLNLFIAAVGIRYKLDKRLELMNGYDSGALPFYMMLTGGLMFFCHLVAIKFCYDATNVDTRSDKHHLFVALIMVIMAMFLFIFINIIIILVHAGKIRSSLEEGIGGSMKAYKSDLARKVTMDNVQTEFECCGVQSYKDWFQIGWVNLMYINTESDDVKRYLKGGEFIKDDAPFSCCSRDSKRACVHHSVLDFKIHRNYEAVNLNNVGCVDAVMAYFKAVLIVPTALLLFVILILEAIDIVVMRMLQTSIFTADEINDPEAATEAYCIKGLGGGGDVRELFRRKKD